MNVCKNTFVYIDDIIVHGKYELEHDNCLLTVWKKSLEYNVKFNFEKSLIKKEKIEILCHVMHNETIEIIKTNTKTKILDKERHKSKKMPKLIGCIT